MKNKVIWLVAAIVFSASAPAFSQGWARPLIKMAQKVGKEAIENAGTYLKKNPPIQPRFQSTTLTPRPMFTPKVSPSVQKILTPNPATQRIAAVPKYRTVIPPVVVAPAKKQWKPDPDAVKLGVKGVKAVAKAKIKEKEEEKKKQYKKG